MIERGIREALAKVRHRKQEMIPSNLNHAELVKRCPETTTFSCSDGHAAVELLDSDSCAQCGGSDPTGADFCPICDFCCGC